jgi:hypothetical protein
MIGGDGAHYGPVSLEQMKGWIGEGRVTAETKILRSDTNSWLPASQYVELGVVPTPPPVAAMQSPAAAMMMSNPMLERRVKVSANWFYWIAGLSLINTFIAFSGKGGIQFVVGLAVTQVSDAFAARMDNATMALVFDILAAAIFAMFGFFAGKRQNWSFIVGMVFYAADGLLCLAIQSMLGLGFHVFVLYCLFKGVQANEQLKRESR